MVDPQPTPKPEDVVREALMIASKAKPTPVWECENALLALKALIQQRDTAVAALEKISLCPSPEYQARRLAKIAEEALATIAGKEG
jgi:hypothetical protein